MLIKLRDYLPLSKEKKFDFKYKIQKNKLIIDMDFYLYKHDLFWKTIKLKLVNECVSKSASPVNWKKKYYEKEFIIDKEKEQIIIDLDYYDLYSYRGRYIDLNLQLETELDDKIFFDTIVNKKIIREVNYKDRFIKNVFIMKPKDHFSFYKSFNALSFMSKFFIIFFAFAILVLLIFILISIPIMFYFYFIIFIILVWVVFLKIIESFFQKYMTFKLKTKHFFDNKDKVYKLSEFITWKSRVDLHNIRVKVVASNFEKWQHTVWSWKSRRTETFEKSVNWVVLSNELIQFIPKNSDIADYVKWSFSLKKMYEKLYPPLKITDNHWIGVRWEIQLISNDLVDREIVWPTDFMKYKDFLIYK